MEEKYIEKIVANEQSAKQAHKRLDEAETRIEALEKTYSIMEKMNYRMERVEDSVEKIDKKLDENYNEKSKKWDKLIDYLFYAILGGVIAVVFTKIGLN